MTVQRPTRDPGDLRIADDGLSVEYDRHKPAHQRNIIGLPIPRPPCRLNTRREEPIHRADYIIRRLRAFQVLDLHFIPAPQVYAAVTFFRIPELDMQLEI